MTRQELIDKCTSHLGAALGCHLNNQHENYAEHMQLILDLLTEELFGEPPDPRQGKPDKFNPEKALQEIAIAIKHRTYSSSERWKIVYYHTRITCVPVYLAVPPEIVLHEFTERMVQRGFTTTYWNQLKANVIKLYKELHK